MNGAKMISLTNLVVQFFCGRLVRRASAACPTNVKTGIFEKFVPVIHEIYDAPELGGVAIMDPEHILVKPLSCGKPRSGTDVVLLNVHKEKITAPGAPGSDIEGHRRPDEKTEEFRLGEYFFVGDLVYFDDDGYLYISDLVPDGDVDIVPASNKHSTDIDARLAEGPVEVQSVLSQDPHHDTGEPVFFPLGAHPVPGSCPQTPPIGNPSPPPSPPSQWCLKVTAGNDIRRLPFPTSLAPSYQDILRGVSLLFHLPLSSMEASLLLKYSDSEVDSCTLTAATFSDALPIFVPDHTVRPSAAAINRQADKYSPSLPPPSRQGNVNTPPRRAMARLEADRSFRSKQRQMAARSSRRPIFQAVPFRTLPR